MLSLNIPPWKLFIWFQRLQFWATGDWQLHQDNVPAHASCFMQFFGETSNYSGSLAHLQLRFGTLWLRAFPKTKITFEREEILEYWWDSGKFDEAANGDWENCVMSQGAYFKGEWGVMVLCAMFLISCFFFYKCLNFSQYMDGCFLDRPGRSNGKKKLQATSYMTRKHNPKKV